MHDLNIVECKYKLPNCTRGNCPFIYNPVGHVITGDHNIIKNTSQRDVFAKGPKCCEPKCINWKQTFTIIMDSIDDYTRQWAKREKEDLDTLFEWVKMWDRWYKLEFKNAMGLWALALHQYLITQMLLNTCLSFMTNMLLAPPTRP